MSAVILRRKWYGNPSVGKIVAMMKQPVSEVRNWCDEFPEDTDLVIRWGTTSNAPCRKVVNTAGAIHAAYNKTEMRKTLQEGGLCPPTMFSKADTVAFWPSINQLPVIIRPKHHEAGRDFHRCNTVEEAITAWDAVGVGGYANVFIDIAVEYRVVIAQGRVLWVVLNDHISDKWGYIRWSEWDLRAVDRALVAFARTGLDFGAVDVMVDAEGTPWVTEVNTAPEVCYEYQPGLLAKAFDYMIDNGKKTLPSKPEATSWKQVIHPAVSEQADV